MSLMRRTPLKNKTPMKRSATPMMRATPIRTTPMPPPRAAIKARKKRKKKPKTVYRNPGLLALAKGEECLTRVPSYCWGGTESTVSAHSNRTRDGKGKGIKAHDWAIAFACGGCHFFLDQSKAPREMKLSYFIPGLRLTRERIIAMGKWPDEAERGFQLLYGETS